MSLKDPFQDLDEVWTSRSVRPARHSEARRQPARHSRRAQHVFVVTKQASTVKTKPGWPRAGSHSC